MTDSTINGGSSEGELDFGSSVEELFGDLEDDSLDDEIERPDRGGEADGIEDRTAADVFNQLKSETEGIDTVSVLEDQTPEEIIERADEPDETLEQDDDLVEDEAALENLLLTGRTKGEEFLWIDTGDSTGPGDGESTDDTPEATSQAATETESGTGNESGPDRDGGTGDTGPRSDVSGEIGVTPDEVEADELTFEDVESDESNDNGKEESISGDSDEVEPAAESTELVAVDSEDTDLVPDEEESEESSGGILAWIRSKLPF